MRLRLFVPGTLLFPPFDPFFVPSVLFHIYLPDHLLLFPFHSDMPPTGLTLGFLLGSSCTHCEFPQTCISCWSVTPSLPELSPLRLHYASALALTVFRGEFFLVSQCFRYVFPHYFFPTSNVPCVYPDVLFRYVQLSNAPLLVFLWFPRQCYPCISRLLPRLVFALPLKLALPIAYFGLRFIRFLPHLFVPVYVVLCVLQWLRVFQISRSLGFSASSFMKWGNQKSSFSLKLCATLQQARDSPLLGLALVTQGLKMSPAQMLHSHFPPKTKHNKL